MSRGGADDPLRRDDAAEALRFDRRTLLPFGDRRRAAGAPSKVAVTAERRRIGWATRREYRDIYLFLLAAAGLSAAGLVIRL